MSASTVPRGAGRTLRRIAFWLTLIVALAPAAFVFFWMVTSSFKQQVDIYTIPPQWLNFSPTLDNYRSALEQTPFTRYMMNSLLVATASSLFGLMIGLPAAYSIARYRQSKLSLSLLTARLLPGVAYLVPFFVAFTALRMVGSYPALILSHVIITFPLTVFIMVNFFAGLPAEIYDAAEVDGCGRLETFWRIALPLTRPGMLTAGILAFIFSWNDFKMALILSDGDTRTLPVAVFNFVHEASLDWGPMMAYATIIMIPVLILTLFAQRHIVTGMTMGSVK
ncbi:carbohydrate ABC transporter permease [Micromonospora sp. NBC_01813]|uniref:carbohydrate ABC transporter permease n=1 Tax=Micromonospora sp. NBC_01813 TaxID=2975988 RepID=UPI002DD7FD7D|nr:carbohydrate ABC transporter permease [Micromonospora sp. NBC_01813]WSA07262.1 carbohydrate ABC transporter permease [Micromonospora sp. NBC_01813]